MPELPEVETVRLGLARLLPGRVIQAVDFDTPKSFPNAPEDVRQFLIGAAVVVVARRAKVLLIELSSKYLLIIHLKMTGQLVFNGRMQKEGKKEVRFAAGHPNDSLIASLPDKSTRVTFTFTDGSKLFFNDFRKFGWVRLLPTAEVPQIDFFQKVGPEPLAADFTADILYKRLQRRAKSVIKAAILDQTTLAGIGNIYADESLWGAKIHPETRVFHLDNRHIKVLHGEIQKVLQLSIDKGGSTDKTYVDAEGHKGSYLQFANVFRRQGLPCNRCSTTIEKIRVAGRGTHVCPHCQKVQA